MTSAGIPRAFLGQRGAIAVGQPDIGDQHIDAAIEQTRCLGDGHGRRKIETGIVQGIPEKFENIGIVFNQ